MALQRRLQTAITTKNASVFLEKEASKMEETGDLVKENDERHEIGSQLIMLKKRHD
jgi:hypothetical protein